VVVYEYGQPTEPTFVVCNRREVIDLTLGTNKIVYLVSNWQASDAVFIRAQVYMISNR
jgi:hypothetical protein